jgi:hypothetical protein
LGFIEVAGCGDPNIAKTPGIKHCDHIIFCKDGHESPRRLRLI